MLKRIGIGAAIVLGLIVAAIGLLIVFFPKDAAIAEAERRIEAATHRQLTISGEVELTFWPALGFSAEQASLSNPDGFDASTPFLSANRIIFAVAVLPLLRGDIQVKRLIFDGAELHLRAKQSGEANWTFPTDETSSSQNTIEDLRLDEVRLSNSLISFESDDGQPPLTISNVNGGLKLDSLDQPAALESSFDYRGQAVDVTAEIAKPRAVLEQGQTPLTTEIKAAPLNATFNGAFNAANGALNGRLGASGDSLRALSAWLGSPMADGGGFAAYRVDADMAHLEQETRLTNASISLDDIRAQGNLIINMPPAPARMHVAGTLSAPSVDLNTYLPPPAEGAAGPGVQTNTAWPTDRIDLSGLKAMDADLNLNIAALKFQRLSFSNVAMVLRIANGAADARLNRISLYGGGGTARLIADGAAATPRIAVELSTQNIQAEPLLRDAIGLDKIAGRGQLTASFIGQGASQAAIMRSLRGTANFTFNDGQWKGVNLAQVARTIQAALSGQAVAAGASTDFAEMSAAFQIANGVAATDNLRVLNPYARLEGQGLIDIGAQTLDMRVAPRAVNSIEGQGGNAGIAGLGIPFRISGPWSQVNFRPDLGNVVQNELRSRMGSILGRQDQSSPLTQLGASLFGQQPAQSGATTTTTPSRTTTSTTTAPAQQPPAQEQKQRTPEDQARDAIGNLFGRH